MKKFVTTMLGSLIALSLVACSAPESAVPSETPVATTAPKATQKPTVEPKATKPAPAPEGRVRWSV